MQTLLYVVVIVILMCIDDIITADYFDTIRGNL